MVRNPTKFIEEAIAAQPDFSIERLGAALLCDFGGEEGLAAKIFQEYEYAEPGSNTRKTILEMVYKTLERAAPEMGASEGVDPEDLRAEAKALLDDA